MNGKIVKILKMAAIAVLVAVVLTVLSVVPPLSFVYQWAERSNMQPVWSGLVAGTIALCLLLYRKKAG